MGRSVMYIQTDYYNLNMRGAKNDVNFWKKMRQKLLDCIPEKTLEDNARNVTKWKKYNDSISNPATNRLIMGVTALATQPAIDYHNHKVDKETREISAIRTISKIIAGATVGIAVRYGCYKLTNKMTNIKGTGKNSKALLPTKYLDELLKNEDFLAKHKNAISTGMAILAMCITNFVLDAPLTVFLTNYFNDKRKEKKEERRLKDV